MKNDSNHKEATFWRGMFVGVIVGSIVTMLYTPRSGREMRSTIKEKAGKTKAKLGEWKHRSKQEDTQVAQDLESMAKSEG